jgi:hypothetical protein
MNTRNIGVALRSVVRDAAWVRLPEGGGGGGVVSGAPGCGRLQWESGQTVMICSTSSPGSVGMNVS